MTLQLPPEMEQFIKDRVKTGEYASAQEVVCAGLLLLKMRVADAQEDDFGPGEWDRLLAEAEGTKAMTLDQAIARRRAERKKGRP